MTLAPVPRPVGVTTVAVIAFVQSSFGILGGLALIIERNDRELIAHVRQSSGRITTYGVAAIIWGVVTFFAALGLWNGANWARILVGIVEVTNVAAGLYLLFAWSGTYVWNGIWQIGIALLVLYFLFGSRGDEFSRAARPESAPQGEPAVWEHSPTNLASSEASGSHARTGRVNRTRIAWRSPGSGSTRARGGRVAR
jgi:hypothetical protein